MNQKSLKILQLYPNEMNIYGDRGNLLALAKRARQHGFEVEIASHNPGDVLATDADIIIGGGGQDSGQQKVQADLATSRQALHNYANAGTPMLMICGMYQLFGNEFITASGDVISGIGIFDAKTIAKDKRLIGNITIYNDNFGEIVGYENHSGQTFLAGNTKPLGQVRIGFGNNVDDAVEGAIYNNVIGSYLHGALLPKNPRLTDFLIEQAAIKKYGEFSPQQIDDSLAEQARHVALKRPR